MIHFVILRLRGEASLEFDGPVGACSALSVVMDSEARKTRAHDMLNAENAASP